MGKEIKFSEIAIGVIGCGGQGRAVVENFLSAGAGRVRVAAVYDPSSESIERARSKWPGQQFRERADVAALVNDPEVNLVMIFTPNAFHAEAILAALSAGKQVFSEKPLATTLADCRRVIAAESQAGISVMTGFVLRYAPVYRKVHELLASGTFGKMIGISASENRISYGGGNSMAWDLGWRRMTKFGGPYLLEKCCHDFDLLNWFADSRPIRAAGFGGCDLFIPENSYIWDKFPHRVFAKNLPEKNRINPFTSEKDIFDNNVVILEYANGVKATFQLTLANAIEERRMYISCAEGTIIADDAGFLRYRRYGDAAETTVDFRPAIREAEGGHGGGNAVMARELCDYLLGGPSRPASGTRNALACAVAALAADESMRTGKVITIPESFE